MNGPEFRFYFFTSRYAETVAFYRDALGLAIFRSWDRGPDARGTVFRSPNGVGLIEIEAGDTTPSIHGGFYIEVAQIDRWYGRVKAAGCPILKALGPTEYGHRNFRTADPNGVHVTLFEYLKEAGGP
ncbi:VOC family protein [Fulvimonas yonginensis]|uniref:VOC family protein n=1 Tax=Fulvimonas yonginensis TaxID=1495200 RepID=A0ABU8JEB1_9GAMM